MIQIKLFKDIDKDEASLVDVKYFNDSGMVKSFVNDVFTLMAIDDDYNPIRFEISRIGEDK